MKEKIKKWFLTINTDAVKCGLFFFVLCYVMFTSWYNIQNASKQFKKEIILNIEQMEEIKEKINEFKIMLEK